MRVSGMAGSLVDKRVLALLGGPLLALLLWLWGIFTEQPAVGNMAAVALWMALWWITEPVPLAVTALLPMALFPLLHIMSGKETAPLYFNSTILLFIGGFIIALAMQRWELHKRIALGIVAAIGVSPGRLLLGFLIATAFISMWMSNTATAMMMLPIALAVILKLEDSAGKQQAAGLSIALLLAIAYASSIGGIATPVGTPPNLSFLRIFHISFPAAPQISFTQWMLFAVPLAALMLAACWLYLNFAFVRRARLPAMPRDSFRRELAQLGPISFEEWQVLCVFCLTALLWITGADAQLGSFSYTGWIHRLGLSEFVDDGTVGITMGLLLFVLPARREHGGALMRWEDAAKLPWGIVLLFGGGFALAQGFIASGLSTWCGAQLAGLAGLPPLAVVGSVATVLTFLTELTSNTATTEMALPVLAATAVAIGVNPLLLMVPGTLSASLGFMLPAGTPPNAIVFGTGHLSIAQMARAGFWLNLIGIALTTVVMLTLGRLVLHIDLSSMPAWATGQ